MDVGVLVILLNAVVLGARHGIDWDHIAAITDIIGTAANTEISGGVVALGRQRVALRLSTSYALGHATMVLVLGLAAITFAAALPAWIDPLMERAVGVTLLALSGWIFFSLLRYADDDTLVMQSRWMFVLERARAGRDWLNYLLTGRKRQPEVVTNQYDAPTAFAIGVIHGFGAETGTQVLLIASVGGAANHLLGTSLLLSFILGLLISNTLVAILSYAGFMGTARFKPLMIATSVLTGIFSLIVGLSFVLGMGSALPAIQH